MENNENNATAVAEKIEDNKVSGENTENKKPKTPVKEIIRRCVFALSSVVFIVALVIFLSTLLQSQKAIRDEEENRSVADTTAATSINEAGEIVTIPPTEEEKQKHNVDLNAYYSAKTDDYIGYLWLDGAKISDPVVKGADNEYYLTHTYYGEKNKAGAIFMDWRVVIEEETVSPNIVIYGHNQEDGTMFGDMKLYKHDIEHYNANPFVQFNTLYDVGEYVIYGYFITNALEAQDSNGEVFRYHDQINNLDSADTFAWYMDEIGKRNQIISPVDVEFGDQLLTLSTCSDEFTNSRFVIFARKLREGETHESFDFTKTRHNYTAQGVDWDAIIASVNEQQGIYVEDEFNYTLGDETTEPVVTTTPVTSDDDEIVITPAVTDEIPADDIISVEPDEINITSENTEMPSEEVTTVTTTPTETEDTQHIIITRN
ncbi:MAG: class B sortase [Ruminococcus sp.]|jgi:sortase B|nr:class B sortase [Ruminococcus sp.]